MENEKYIVVRWDGDAEVGVDPERCATCNPDDAPLLDEAEAEVVAMQYGGVLVRMDNEEYW